MSTVADIFPRNKSGQQVATAIAMSDSLPIPLRDILNPAVTPPEFLPFLAAHESVDLWFEDWPIERKRDMVGEAPVLATLKGTRAGVIRFLTYVDADLLDAIAYPARFVLGRAVLGRTPIGHKAFVARYLIKVVTHTPPRAFVLGRAVLGRNVLKTPSREPIRRALVAIRAAKAPDTEIRVDFAHKRMLEISDAPLLDDGHYLGEFLDRAKL